MVIVIVTDFVAFVLMHTQKNESQEYQLFDGEFWRKIGVCVYTFLYVEKTCAKHGYFKDIYWSDPVQFKRFEKYWHDGDGVLNPSGPDGNCPHSCGICTSHKTTTILANIDVTNRCNQACPVCFANASASGYLYEPSLTQIRAMMQMLRNEKPVSCPAVQFAD